MLYGLAKNKILSPGFLPDIWENCFILIIHFDDILIMTSEKEMHCLKRVIKTEFHWVMMEGGILHSYLGMQIEFAQGEKQIVLQKHFFKYRMYCNVNSQ